MDIIGHHSRIQYNPARITCPKRCRPKQIPTFVRFVVGINTCLWDLCVRRILPRTLALATAVALAVRISGSNDPARYCADSYPMARITEYTYRGCILASIYCSCGLQGSTGCP